MTIRTFVKVNILLFFIFLLASNFSTNWNYFYYLKSVSGFLLLIFASFSLAFIIEKLFNKDFDAWERTSLAALCFIIGIPSLLTIQFAIFSKIYPILALNILFLIYVVFIILVWRKRINFNNFIIDFSGLDLKSFLHNPLTWSLVIGIIVTIISVTAYDFLPDKDPYKWLSTLENRFEDNELLPLTYRPLFSSIAYLLLNIAGISISSFLKYFISFSYLLSFFPAYLVAKQFKLIPVKLFSLLLVFVSANVILYSQVGMPQAIFLTLCNFIIYFLLYSHLTGKTFFYYLAGLIATISIFFHELSLIIFAVWIFSTLIHERLLVWKYKKDLIYLVIIIGMNYQLLKFDFLSRWTSNVFHRLINFKANFLFPLAYENVAGKEMGWGNLTGVLKYYLYYASPLFFFFLLVIIFYLIKNKNYKLLFHKIFSSSGVITLFLCFASFFTISEIMPRFPGISLLPERAWLFTIIFFGSLVVLFFNSEFIKDKQKTILSYIGLTLIFISIGGALYINNQKQFLITHEEIKSFEWINNNLPAKRKIISAVQEYGLGTYANSTVSLADPDFYYLSEPEIMEIITTKESYFGQTYKDYFGAYLDNLKQDIKKEEFNYDKTESPDKRTKVAKKSVLSNIQKSQEFLASMEQNESAPEVKNKQNIYIYYSKPNKQNPYLNRPYFKEKIMLENSGITLDQLTEKFRRIYTSDDGNIIIWEVL